MQRWEIQPWQAGGLALQLFAWSCVSRARASIISPGLGGRGRKVWRASRAVSALRYPTQAFGKSREGGEQSTFYTIRPGAW